MMIYTHLLVDFMKTSAKYDLKSRRCQCNGQTSDNLYLILVINGDTIGDCDQQIFLLDSHKLR